MEVYPENGSTLHIEGGHKLSGVHFVQGSKNAILPMIAASLIPTEGQTVIRNVPPINDVKVALEILKRLGCKVQYFPSEQTVAIDASGLSSHELPADLTGLIRGSVLFMAPLLLRTGKVRLPQVGGCDIGPRSLDFHHRGFVRLGAEVNDEDGITIQAKELKGTFVYLDMPSHTGTENLMMTACMAEGETLIENASSDPEIVDFANFLSRMGAKIEGVGSRTIRVEGVKALRPVDYTAMSDRMDAGLFMMAAGITGSDITLIGARLDHLRLVEAKLAQMGLDITQDGSLVHIKGPERPLPINIATHPYPGFPTDLQAGIMTLSCMADGTSYIRETVFEGRFKLANELERMGAKIEVGENNRLALVYGPKPLKGTRVVAHNLRAGTSLILAGLAAEGETTIENAYQIDRGHYNIEEMFSQLGAIVKREE